MELYKFIRIFSKPEDVITEELKKKHEKKNVLLHTLLASVILNAGIAMIFIEEPVLGILIALPAFLLTIVSIPIIEYLTYLTARSQGGTGDYWSQLNITNIYITPIFLLFFIVFAFITILSFSGVSLPDSFHVGLDTISFVLVIYINSKKIKLVHKIEKTLIPSIVYAITVAVAYILWLVLVFGIIFLLLAISMEVV